MLKTYLSLLLGGSCLCSAISSKETDSTVSDMSTTVFASIAEYCIPAVVKVAVLRTPDDSALDRRSVFLGSGFLVSSDGLIVTCQHVVEDAVSLTVFFENQEIEALLIQEIPEIDIAMLKIDGQNLPFLKLGDSDSLSIGEWIISIGFPFSLSPFIARGIIGSIDDHIDSLILDILTCPGNSGGPILNLDGEVIGISSALLQFGQEIRGPGMAIPINLIKHHLQEITSTPFFNSCSSMSQ